MMCCPLCCGHTISFLIMVIISIILVLQTLINEALASTKTLNLWDCSSVSFHAAIDSVVVNSLVKAMLAMVTHHQRLRSGDDEIL